MDTRSSARNFARSCQSPRDEASHRCRSRARRVFLRLSLLPALLALGSALWLAGRAALSTVWAYQGAAATRARLVNSSATMLVIFSLVRDMARSTPSVRAVTVPHVVLPCARALTAWRVERIREAGTSAKAVFRQAAVSARPAVSERPCLDSRAARSALARRRR